MESPIYTNNLMNVENLSELPGLITCEFKPHLDLIIWMRPSRDIFTLFASPPRQTQVILPQNLLNYLTCFECNWFGNVTCYNMHEYEGVFSTVPLLTMQQHLPFELLFTATSLEGTLQVRLTKLPDVWNFSSVQSILIAMSPLTHAIVTERQ